MPFVARSFILQGRKAIERGGTPQVVAGDYCYTISAVYYFSKYPEVAITFQVTSTAAIKFLLSNSNHEGDPRETSF